jgi:hypothetical protein
MSKMTVPNSQNSREMVISFENFVGDGTPAGALPAFYSGCSWCENSWFVRKGLYPSTVISGRGALFNAHGRDIAFERRDPFHLKGMRLSSLWEESVEVLLEGWRQGLKSYSQTVTVPRTVTKGFDLDYRDIDRVLLRTGGAHILVDSITLDLG